MSAPTQNQAWEYSSRKADLTKDLRLVTEPLPPSLAKPNSKQHVVEVLTMAVNPADWKLPSHFFAPLVIKTPAAPGLDFCGRLVSTGALVFGDLGWPYQHGSLSQHILAPDGTFAPLPDGVSVNEGAALSVAGLTAHQSLAGYIRPGDRVLVNGGSGGTGTFCIQIAKILGCHVTATCSERNSRLCRDLGADELVDYRTGDLADKLTKLGPFDHLVDNVGHDPGLHRKSNGFLKPEGTFVLVAAMDHDWAGIRSMLASWLRPRWLGGARSQWKLVLKEANPKTLEQLGEWVKEGKLKVVVDEVFAWEDAPKAYEKLKTGRARGKILVSRIGEEGNNKTRM